MAGEEDDEAVLLVHMTAQFVDGVFDGSTRDGGA